MIIKMTLSFEDDAIRKFDPHHQQNYYFSTDYRPKPTKEVCERNLKILKWNAVDFHVRYSLFVTNGRCTYPVFEDYSR